MPSKELPRQLERLRLAQESLELCSHGPSQPLQAFQASQPYSLRQLNRLWLLLLQVYEEEQNSSPSTSSLQTFGRLFRNHLWVTPSGRDARHQA